MRKGGGLIRARAQSAERSTVQMKRSDDFHVEAAVASYLHSAYFADLAPMTRAKRRGLLRNICDHVRRLSAAEIPEARNEIPSETPAHSVPWRPVHQRRNWTTA